MIIQRGGLLTFGVCSKPLWVDFFAYISLWHK